MWQDTFLLAQPLYSSTRHCGTLCSILYKLGVQYFNQLFSPLMLTFFSVDLIPFFNFPLSSLSLSLLLLSISVLSAHSFHFFIEVITSVSLFSPASIFLDLCILLLPCLPSTHDLWWIIVTTPWVLFLNSVQ